MGWLLFPLAMVKKIQNNQWKNVFKNLFNSFYTDSGLTGHYYP